MTMWSTPLTVGTAFSLARKADPAIRSAHTAQRELVPGEVLVPVPTP
jgi:hypothetical protein